MQFCRKCLAVMLVLGVLFMSVPNLYADQTSEAILRLLIKKGVITQDEVDALKAEISRERPVAPAGLEERVSALEEKTKKPLVAVGEGDLAISGYVQTRYTNNKLDSASDGFSISNAKITLKGHLEPEVSYKFEIGPHQSTSILYDAYATISYIPYMDISAGQFKIPFAQEYITSSSSIDTILRSNFMTKTKLANEYGIGVMASSKDLFNGALEYYTVIESGRDRNGAEDTDSESFVGRIVLNPFKNSDSNLKGLQLGTSTQIGKQDSGATYDGMRRRYLAYLKYDLKDILMEKDYFKIQSEYIFQTRDRASNVTPDNTDQETDGWYVMVNYKFPLSLFNRDMHIEPVLKFEQYDPDRAVSRDREDWYTAGVNLHINKYVKWMTNYVWKAEQSGAKVSNDQILTQLQYKF